MVVLALSSCGGGSSSAPMPSLTLGADSTTVVARGSVILYWASENATSCTASGGQWSGTKALQGTETETFDVAGTYQFDLTCSANGVDATQSVAIKVTQNTGDFNVSLVANPTAVALGDSTTLTWSAPGATACIASGQWSGTQDNSGSTTIVLDVTGEQDFTLTCTNGTSSASQTAVVQAAAATVTLTSSSASVGAGQPVTLQWTSTSENSCTASGEWSGAMATSGSESVTIATVGSHSFTLTCSTDAGVMASSTVTVQGVAPTLTMVGYPPQLTAGLTETLTWSSSNAQSCTASGAWSGSQPTAGSQTFTLSTTGTTSYQLSCSNAGGNATASATPQVVAPLALPDAVTYQMNVDHDGSTTFSGSLQFPASPSWSVPFSGNISYPVIAGGVVFITVADSGNYGTQLYALNQTTGAIVWGPIALSGTYFFSNVAYENGTLFVINFDGLLRSFDAASGSAGWSTSLPGQYAFSAPPTAYGGIVFVGGAGSGGTLYAVDETSGAVLWTQPVANGDDSSPSVLSSGVYVSYPCQIYDFLPVSGAPIWHQSNGCDGGGGATSAVRDGILYGRDFSVSGGGMLEFNASTGAQIGPWSSDTINAVTSTTSFVMNSGNLQAIDIASGATLWTFAGDGHLVSAPIVVNDRVIVGSSSGLVYAVDTSSGAQQWSGNTGAGILASDNEGVTMPVTGLAAGGGYLIVPSGATLTAWKIVP